MTSLDVGESLTVVGAAAAALPTSCVAFSTSLLGVAVGRRVKVFATAALSRTAQPLAEFEHTGSVTALDFSPQFDGSSNVSSNVSSNGSSGGGGRPTLGGASHMRSSLCVLCVSHTDGVTLWADARDSESHEHTVLDEPGNNKRCVVFSGDGKHVAVAVGDLVCIVCVRTRRQVVRLEGHGADVTAMAFSIFRPQQLCTASEDRTFKLWDIRARCLLYQSAVVSPHPFTSLAFDPRRERLVLGSEDGKLRFYAITWRGGRSVGGGYAAEDGIARAGDPSPEIFAHVREEHCLDVGTLLQKRHNVLRNSKEGHSSNSVRGRSAREGGTMTDPNSGSLLGFESESLPQVVSSLPIWAQDLAAETAAAVAGGGENGRDGDSGEGGSEDEEDEFPKTVLSLYFRRRSAINEQKEAHDDDEYGDADVDDIIFSENGGRSDAASWKHATSWLVVGTPCALMHINTSSFVVDAMLDLRSVDAGAGGGRRGSSNRSRWRGQRSERLCHHLGSMPSPDATSRMPGQRGVLSPLTAQAMAMGKAQQRQAVPLQMTASCFSFIQYTASDRASGGHGGGDDDGSSNSNNKAPPTNRREVRRRYYARRLLGAGDGGVADGGEAATMAGAECLENTGAPAARHLPIGSKSGLLCVIGSAFLPGINVLRLPVGATKPRGSENAAVKATKSRRGQPSVGSGTTTATGPMPPLAPSSGNSLTSPRIPPNGHATSFATVDIVAAPEPLSLFPAQGLPQTSVLRNHEFRVTGSPPASGKAGRRKNTKTTKRGKPSRSAVKNKPVTFHTRIRSSGYGKTQPVMKLGGNSKLSRGKGSRRHVSNKGADPDHTSASGKTATTLLRMDGPIPTHHQMSHQISMDGADKRGSLHTGPVLRVVYSRGATDVATASADRSSISMRLPCSKYAGEKHRARYLGHNGPVHSVDWSHGTQNPLLLTASTDGTARLWQRGRPDAVLTFSHWHHGSAHRTTVESGAAADTGSMAALSLSRNRNRSNPFLTQKNPAPAGQHKNNPPFHPTAVAQAGFFYMDKFVMLAVSNSLCLYKYATDHLTDTRNDLRRLQNRSKYKMVGRWQQANTHNISAFACANSFHSPIVIAAGSNRSVSIYDLAHGQEACAIPDAHSRAVTGVALPSFSEYATHPPEAYDTFLTSGAEGSVKLYDLRTAQVVRRFESQPRSKCMAIDPTMRFMCCASREAANVLNVMDLRMGGVLARLQCGSEAVMDAAFSPRHPQLCVGSADGRVRFFGAQ